MPSDYEKEVITPGDAASAIAHQVCIDSFQNSALVDIIPLQPNNFRGPVTYRWKPALLREMLSAAETGRPGLAEAVQNDGAGGKPQFFTFTNLLQAWFELPWEPIVMCNEDLARNGCMPAIFVNELCVNRVTKQNFPAVQQMFGGLAAALRQSRMAAITGEFAVMRESVTSFCRTDDPAQISVTWGGMSIGLSRPERFIDGSTIKPGMAVVSLNEHGYRCNGGGLFTQLIKDVWGTDVAKLLASADAQRFVRELTRPSLSFSNLILKLLGWNPDGSLQDVLARIYGIAHITGGGVWKKFGEMLPKGVGARLDTMPEPPAFMLDAQRMAHDTAHPLCDWDCYGNLHGGSGMLIVCHPDDEGVIIEEARRQGRNAQHVGMTVEDPSGDVVILSKFGNRGEKLSKLNPPK